MSNISYENLGKGDIVFFSRILPKNNYYKVLDLKIVSIHDDYCTGTDLKTKQTYPLDKELAEKALFYNKSEALNFINLAKKQIGKDGNGVM